MNVPRRQETAHHWVFLGLTAAVLGLAGVLEIHGDETVVLPLVGIPVPETCYFKRALGINCPGCGLTRCFICAIRGEIPRAWHFNPAGLAVFLFVALQGPYRVWQLWRIRRGQEECRPVRLGTATVGLLTVLLVAQWLWRLLH